MRLIVTSQQDAAGRNIFALLEEKLGFRRAGEFEGMPVLKHGDVLAIATSKKQVEAEHLDEHFSPEYYVFATRHRSESGIKTLTVHVPGNLTSQAKVGGKPFEIAWCNASAMKVALQELHRQNQELSLGYQVSLEATHHGPTSLKKPVLFVEVGSTEEQWQDKRACLAVAKAALKAAQNKLKFTPAVGAGGNHYAPRHTQVVLSSEYAIGHIIPSYAIPEITKEMLQQAIEKTQAEFVYLDWKGMKKPERDKILELCSQVGIEVKKGSLSRGGRELKVDLNIFAEAELVSGAELKELKKKLSVERDKHGRPVRILSSTVSEEEVYRACVSALRRRFKVKLEGDSLVLESTSIDTKKAEKLGIPKEKLSELARGLTLEIGGRKITPDEVRRRNTRRIRLSPNALEIIQKIFNL